MLLVHKGECTDRVESGNRQLQFNATGSNFNGNCIKETAKETTWLASIRMLTIDDFLEWRIETLLTT